MLAVGMPSSADSPGTDHWPGSRSVRTAGRPLAFSRMACLLMMLRTCWPVKTAVRLGGRYPAAVSVPAILLLLPPSPAGRGRRGAGLVPGVGELVLAAGAAGGVAPALAALPPELVQGGPLVLGVRSGGHRDLQGRRGHRVEDLPGDVVIERGAGNVLAAVAGPVVHRVEPAGGAVGGAGGRVVGAGRHAVPAAQAAAPQPGPQP